MIDEAYRTAFVLYVFLYANKTFSLMVYKSYSKR